MNERLFMTECNRDMIVLMSVCLFESNVNFPSFHYHIQTRRGILPTESHEYFMRISHLRYIEMTLAWKMLCFCFLPFLFYFLPTYTGRCHILYPTRRARAKKTKKYENWKLSTSLAHARQFRCIKYLFRKSIKRELNASSSMKYWFRCTQFHFYTRQGW